MTENPNLRYHRHLPSIAQADLDYIYKKDAHYDASWKKRDGVGAWFTIVRPMDRLVNFVEHPGGERYDIFRIVEREGLEGPDGSVIACIRDLRRYLLLVEAEVTERLSVPSLGDDLTEVEKCIASWVNNVTEGDSTEDMYGKLAAEVGITRQEAKMRILRAIYGGGSWPEAYASGEAKFAAGGAVEDWPKGFEGPGTPEDGGQHARQVPEEGKVAPPERVTIAEAEEPMPPAPDKPPMVVGSSLFMRLSGPKQQLYTFMGRFHLLTEALPKPVVMRQLPHVRSRYIVPEGEGFALLDRRHYLDEVDDYFLRLPPELNGKEFEEMASWYKPLYAEPTGSDHKRVMKPEYLQGWSRV